MRDPETVDPANPKPAPDATQRLTTGAPTDPNSTQQMDLSKHLNVPQDREKGLHWYRQAAGKGSAAAQAELTKLEIAGK